MICQMKNHLNFATNQQLGLIFQHVSTIKLVNIKTIYMSKEFRFLITAPTILITVSVIIGCVLIILVFGVICIIQCRKSTQRRIMQRNNINTKDTLQQSTYKRNTLPTKSCPAPSRCTDNTLGIMHTQARQRQYGEQTSITNVDYFNQPSQTNTCHKDRYNQPTLQTDTLKIKSCNDANYETPKYYVLDQNLIE